MSGDLTYVEDQMVMDEFIDNLKSLSVSQSPSTYADAIKELDIQLKRSIPNGLSNNKPFSFKIIDNFYRIVPLFDNILSNNDRDGYNNFVQTKNFLQTLAKALDGVCLFEIYTILKDVSPVQLIFQNYIVLLKETYFTDNDKYDDLVNCLLPIITYSSILTPVTEDKLPANLLTYLLTFTKRHWLFQHREMIVRNILSLIKAFSKNPRLIPMIIRTEWPHSCVQWLVNSDEKNNLRPSYMVDYYICLIIQKLARHSIGIQILNQLNCLKRFDECRDVMKKYHTEAQYKCLYVLQCMIYALLMEEDEIKQISLLNDNRMCHVINELVLYTIEASRHDYFFYKCFHISEMLSVLSKLFVNDDILLKFVNEDNKLFDCLCQLMIHFSNIIFDTSRTHQPTDDETLLSVTNLFWSLSFHPCYHEKFQSNPIFMNILSNLATSSYKCTQLNLIPRDMCSLKKAAEGILWNLKPSSPPSTSNQISNEKTERQPLVMISYSHSDTIFCQELVEHLSVYLPIWVDYKQAKDTVAHSDDLWEEIARAMETASVIVLIVSKDYYDSKSCRQELSYASDTLKKRVIPIYAPNQNYRASGWLGIRIAGQKYIHFGRKSFKDAIEELSSTILPNQKPINVPSAGPATCSPCEVVPKIMTDEENKLLLTLKHWTKIDIRKWFEDNHIHNNLITLYIDEFHTGTALIVYARHLKLFYRNEYIRIFKKYSKIFQGKKLDTLDFITFVDALYRLRTEYDPNAIIEDSYEQPSEQQLSYAVKTSEAAAT
ncbi:unnamed protein product [Rotaria sp. Silwood1]|nr:unnamed protein product [Rotaria sp. Silwood1]CAF0945377.1 unnamed protein product [Rotaria sp. Silwood1]CAF3375745.1 unnamed protein product [Rotaria sp. Silwood1]CAF3395558.1 unnamed protein product [Rotaria sp. Silwood1]CAF4485065.1 unnamed protein product [Rotaria sp. Silwood1]